MLITRWVCCCNYTSIFKVASHNIMNVLLHSVVYHSALCHSTEYHGTFKCKLKAEVHMVHSMLRSI